jgi:hypothetical protein
MIWLILALSIDNKSKFAGWKVKAQRRPLPVANAVVVDTGPKYPLLHHLPLGSPADAEVIPKRWGRDPLRNKHT